VVELKAKYLRCEFGVHLVLVDGKVAFFFVDTRVIGLHLVLAQQQLGDGFPVDLMLRDEGEDQTCRFEFEKGLRLELLLRGLLGLFGLRRLSFDFRVWFHLLDYQVWQSLLTLSPH